MDLKLTRLHFRDDGIYGHLTSITGAYLSIGITLEHSYDSGLGNGSYTAKLKPGTYICVRGVHKLHNNVPFETFEVEGVEGHDNILFHVGNFNKDSEGCILIGRSIDLDDSMITGSKVTFKGFMDLQKDVDKFTLTVVNS